ncbi:hypothetical protein [Microvirga alba]|uniref:Uncharacterized protein n=1 Tax=Microvirga alba TaxID=2791025 RepID=A0A931BLR5_9HYPH|nr:hypothetical protein [Microvirga alba]MBF9233397.1 hypothetical protein [Microvirga alba]
MMAFLARHAQGALFAALLTSGLSLVGSLGNLYLTYRVGLATQDRQAQQDRIKQFEASTSQIIDASGDFIAALNSAKDLQPAKAKLRAAMAQQIYETEGLKNLVPGGYPRTLKDYENAVTDFNNISQALISPKDIAVWSERFGRVMDLKKLLVENLRSKLDFSATLRTAKFENCVVT